jgi:glycerol-3-phosphate dehydrogenase (NAD(P)+)
MAIAILGAGSYGTALAVVLAPAGQAIRLWDRKSDYIEQLGQDRCSDRYLPLAVLPNNVQCTSDLMAALKDAHHIILAVPSHAVAGVLAQVKGALPAGTVPNLICASKGLSDGGHLLFEVARELFGDKVPFAQMSGPSFAKEMVAGVPTAVTLAADDVQYAHALQQHLHNPHFRIYVSDDLLGVSLCSAVKNVLAIAVGIADGLEFGANSRAALITRGLAEMTRLGLALGAKRETFMGLAGVGDLVLTATDDQSRNRRLGLALGRGLTLAAAKQQIGQSIEGIRNAQTVYELCQRHQVEMPITEVLRRVLADELSGKEALSVLLARQARDETE